MQTKSHYTFASVLCLATLSSWALAGPDFDEGAKDAGATASTASTVSAGENTAVTRVRGSTSSTALVGAPDLVDMYLVRTGSNPFLFKFDMDMVAGGAPVWAARLTIFKKAVVDCGTVAPLWVTVAYPVASVIKFSAGQSYPILDGNVYMTGTKQKLGAVLMPNAEYYVAVSGATNYPMGINGSCAAGNENRLFSYANGTGIYPATQADLVTRLSSWSDPAGAATGSCIMLTVGVFPLPASSCSSAVPVAGSSVTKAFDFAFAPTISGTITCPSSIINLTKEFFYEWTPSCTGTATVTTCGQTVADTGLEVFAIDSCAGTACAAATTTTIACGDDTCSTQTTVTFSAEMGKTYLVRLTRVWGAGTTGTVRFTCDAPNSTADLNGDGTVNGADLAILLGMWGTSGN
ncbi:MAG: hypothetical protein EXS17_02485 [Phycisphaerales bacterium]|nr:hypothetical protein [Phycisphaerales bacterium]